MGLIKPKRLINLMVYGVPKTIVSDNRRQFISNEFKVFCKQTGIEHVRSPPYHPQSNGQAERTVDTLKRSLTKLKNTRNPYEALQTFLSSYRNTPNAIIGNNTPAELLLGHRPRNKISMLSERRILRMATQFNHHHRHHGTKIKEFAPNTPVYARNFTSNGKYWIPATISKRIGKVIYVIQLESKAISTHECLEEKGGVRTCKIPTRSDTVINHYLL